MLKMETILLGRICTRDGHSDSFSLTLLGPAHLSISKGRGGWVGLGFQFFLDMICCGMIYHTQKDS